MAIAPIVNINGTSREELLDQQLKAWRAVRAAIEALSEATPHGRDFQTASSKLLYDEARADHARRFDALEKIAHELEEIAIKIQEQQGR